MLLTKASEYALLSLIYISSKSTPCDVDTMATELEIPKSFLAKILQNLARDGLLHSYKGAKGGFTLAKEPSAYTLKEILASAEKKRSAFLNVAMEFALIIRKIAIFYPCL